MSDLSATHAVFSTRIRNEAGRLTWLGVGLIILGVLAVILPEVATFVATLFVGSIFLVAGIGTVFGSFSIRGTGPFFGHLLLGLLSVALGVFLIFKPLVGAAMLTMVIGVLFMIQGASEIFLAFEARPDRGWGWMLFSAIVSILLAIVIISGWPGTSLFALGIILGVNFITSGAAYLALANAAKRVVVR